MNVIGQDMVGGLVTTYIFDNPPEKLLLWRFTCYPCRISFIQMVGHKGGAAR